MTLVDSSAGIAETLRACLVEAGVAVTAEQTWPWVGAPLDLTVEGLAPGVDREAVVERYRTLYPQTGVPSTTLLPGAASTLEAVHAHGGRVLVVSAKLEAAVRTVLRHVGLDGPDATHHHVDDVVGGLFGAAKGAALVERGATIYVGDHPGDIAAAQVAGATAVAVATGPHDAAALRAFGPDVVLPDLLGFPAWLAAHLRRTTGSTTH